MLSKATLAKIAAITKLPVADVEAAAEATDEQDLAIPEDLQVFTKTELGTRDSNLKKVEFKKGQEASLEILIKDKKKELSLEFEGKDPVAFFEAYDAKVLEIAKVAPNEVIQEKEKSIKTLQATIKKLEDEKTQTLEKMSKSELQNEILRAVPINLKAGIEPDEVLATMERKGYTFEKKDGKIIAKKDGELVGDTALNPLPLKDVVTGYVTERGWLDGEAADNKEGRGGENSKKKVPTSTPTKLSDAQKQWEAEGKNVGTADFQRYVDGLQTANKNFDLDN